MKSASAGSAAGGSARRLGDLARRQIDRLRLRRDQRGKRFGRAQAVAQAAQVTRAAPPQRQTRQGPGDIAAALQRRAQVTAEIAAGQQPVHRVQPPGDSVGIQQRPAEPGGQQPRPAGADRAVDGGEQGAFAAA